MSPKSVAGITSRKGCPDIRVRKYFVSVCVCMDILVYVPTLVPGTRIHSACHVRTPQNMSNYVRGVNVSRFFTCGYVCVFYSYICI